MRFVTYPTSCTGHAYDVWKTTPPDSIEQEMATEQARLDYIEDWIDGALYDDGEIYSRPFDLLAETPEMITALVEAKGDAELLAAAKALRKAFAGYISDTQA